MSIKRLPLAVKFFVGLLPKLTLLIIMAAVSLVLLPFYGLGCLIWYRPPNVPYLAQVGRYLRLTWTVRPPVPGLVLIKRIWLTLNIIQKMLMGPILGLAWLLDELLYGRNLNETKVAAPLFVISAGRSGSTQITRYLEEDPQLVAPNILQCMFPYLWLWRLVPRLFGRIMTPEQVRAKITATMPPELVERHETDPFKADTFDGPFYSFHLNHLALALGPEIAITDFNFARIADYDQQLKEKVFVDFVDRIGRKTLLQADETPDAFHKRFYIKGHFLYAADALEKRYPQARFLTVIREPLSRLQSGINYMRVNPADPVLGPPPWEWLSAALEQTESEYSEIEQAWFTSGSHSARCVIRFTEFVNDLRAAMQKVYRACFGVDELPPHIPKEHPPRDRKNYSVNRSLKELGIDEDVLTTRLAGYIEWCQGAEEI